MDQVRRLPHVSPAVSREPVDDCLYPFIFLRIGQAVELCYCLYLLFPDLVGLGLLRCLPGHCGGTGGLLLRGLLLDDGDFQRAVFGFFS